MVVFLWKNKYALLKEVYILLSELLVVLNDHLRRKTISFQKLNTLVLDEADIMLDMGFKEEVDEILKYTSNDRQIWLFSATVKPGISDIMKQHMKDPVSVRVSQQNVGTTALHNFFQSFQCVTA